MAQWITLGIGLTLLISSLAGCANHPGSRSSTGPSGATSSAGGPLPAITVHRTGGLAGVDDRLAIAPDGTWTAVSRAGQSRTGRLSADQVFALAALAADRRLAAEAARSPVATLCRDTYDYDVTVGALRITYTDCPTDPDQPAATKALVRQVEQFTSVTTS